MLLVHQSENQAALKPSYINNPEREAERERERERKKEEINERRREKEGEVVPVRTESGEKSSG